MPGLDDVFGAKSNRPTHPDFWRISEILLANDGAMEAASTNDERDAEWVRRTEEMVDRESALYMAMQRAMFAMKNRGVDPAIVATVAAVWVDAFVTGAQFQARGGHQED